MIINFAVLDQRYKYHHMANDLRAATDAFFQRPLAALNRSEDAKTN